MHGHVDSRSLIISHYDEPGSPLRTWAFLSFPFGEVDLDEIPEEVYERLRQNALHHYEINENRSVSYLGAGFNGQSVVLTLISGIAEGSASALIEGLAKWCTNRSIQNTKNIIAIDTIEDATRLITEHFNPQGTLQALEISISDTNSRFILQDSLDNRYSIEAVKGIPGSIVGA
jgi:hypothetical protein